MANAAMLEREAIGPLVAPQVRERAHAQSRTARTRRGKSLNRHHPNSRHLRVGLRFSKKKTNFSQVNSGVICVLHRIARGGLKPDHHAGTTCARRDFRTDREDARHDDLMPRR
jgi:hypothetical protein